MSWFALVVKPRHEKAVEAQLAVRSVEAYAPLYRARRRWSDRVKLLDLPLFPGYVFSRFPFERRFDVLGAPGVCGVVSFDGKPATLSSAEIDSIRAMIASGLQVAPSDLAPGCAARICHGPLAGITGIVVRDKSSCRLVVNVEMLNRAVQVEIDRESVESLSARN